MIFGTECHAVAHDRQSGFTLIELMVVIAIFAILGTVAFAGMMLGERQSVAYATNDLASDLINARNTAIKEEDSCTVTFNFATPQSYTYTFLNSGKTKTVRLMERWRGEVFFLAVAPAGGAAGPAVDQPPMLNVTFSPRGLVTVGGGSVYVTDRAGVLTATGTVFRVLTAGSGEIETHKRNFTNPTWEEYR